MKLAIYTRLILALAGLLLMCAPLHAIKIEIPKELQEKIAVEKAAEQEELAKELYELTGENGPASSVEEGPASEQESAEESAAAFVLESAEEEEPEVERAEGAGRIAGKVFDKDTGAPVRGVAVLIEGTSTATVSDSEGRYRLNNIPEGSYTLSFVKTGFIEASITDTGVVDGELTKLDFQLPPRPAEMSDEVYELQDFTVTAQQVASQNVALLALRQQSVASIDALSSEDFTKFGASDAADAIKRISGASISDGKYVVFRGLNDRYNTTLVNGVLLPSPDPDRKAVALDIFPTSLFESIVARKTYTTDLPGESSGGSIELRTKGIPDEPFVKLSVGGGGQLKSSETEDFLADPEQVGLWGWLNGEDRRGFDIKSGTSDLVNDYPNNVGGVDFPLMAPNKKKLSAFGDRSYSFSMGGSKAFTDWLTLGAVLGIKVSEKQRSSFKEKFEIDIEKLGGQQRAVLNDVAGRGLVDLGVLTPEEGSLNGKPFGGVLKSEQEYSASMLFGMGAQIADHTSLNYSFLRSESLSATVERTEYYKFESAPPGSLTPNAYYKYLDLELGTEERLLEAHQFSGEHIFEPPEIGEWTFSWYYTAAEMEQSEPDRRVITEWPLDYEGYDTVSAGPSPINRFQRDTEQGSEMLGFNVDKEIEIFDDAVTLGFEFGYDSENSEREFRQLESGLSQKAEVDDLLYAAMPFPNSSRLNDVLNDKIKLYHRAFVNENLKGGVNELVEALFENQVSSSLADISDAQSDVNRAQTDLNAAQSALATFEANLNSAITAWEGIFGLDYETQFDVNNASHVSLEGALKILAQKNGVLAQRSSVDDAQSTRDAVGGTLNTANADLAKIKAEQAAYLSDATALIARIASMPALATDSTAFPTFSFFGNQNYILKTPRGFSVYADEKPTVSNIQHSRVDGLIQAYGENRVKSFYFSGSLKFKKVPIFESIRTAAGFRRESTKLSYDIIENGAGEPRGASLLDATVAESLSIDQDDDLAYLAVIFEITKDLKLHVSRSTTVAKPTFREIAPFPVYNLTDNSVEFGNPGIVFKSVGKYEDWLNGVGDYAGYVPADPAALRDPSLDDNFIVTPDFAGLEIAEVDSQDIRLEYFTPWDGLFAVGYFEKVVDAPIERVYAYDANGLSVNTFINNDNDASLSGFEVEFQQNLGIFNEWFGDDFLPFDWISIGGNYTKLDAEVERSAFEVRNLSALGGAIELKRPLYDQPSYVANAFITFDVEKTGTRITLSQNWLGEQLDRVGGLDEGLSGIADIYWAEFSSINLVIEQKLTDHLKLKFAVKNLNSPVRSTYEDSSFYDALKESDLLSPSRTQLSTSAAGFDRSTQTVEPTYSISISGTF